MRPTRTRDNKMKKFMLFAITIVMMTMVSYAGDANAIAIYANNGDLESVEKGKPHTKEYLDYKKVLDQYEAEIKEAQSCEDLDNAALMLFFSLLSSVDEEYDEDNQMTEEENDLLSKQAEQIDNMIKEKKVRWNCPEEEEEVVPDDYERVMSALDQMESALNSARTCEDLNTAVEIFMAQTEEIDGSTFSDDEAEAFQELSERVGKKLSDKADLLCD